MLTIRCRNTSLDTKSRSPKSTRKNPGIHLIPEECLGIMLQQIKAILAATAYVHGVFFSIQSRCDSNHSAVIFVMIFIITFFSLVSWTLAVSTVYQFPKNGSFVDDIALRKNGNLLVSRIDVPQVWAVDPNAKNASLVHDFSHDNTTITSCFGMTEIDEDVFAVVAGALDIKSFSSTPGSFALWKLDFSKGTNATVSKLLALPEAQALSAVTKHGNLLLIADSPEGAIWRVNLETSEYKKVISDKSMLPVEGGPPMGVNGIQVQDGYLYYASTTQEEFRRVRINEQAEATGGFELITNGTALDSFDLDAEGTAYVATNMANSIVKISPDGKIDTIAGGAKSKELVGPTSCLIHGKSLYAGTNGGILAPAGSFKEPGKIAVVELS